MSFNLEAYIEFRSRDGNGSSSIPIDISNTVKLHNYYGNLERTENSDGSLSIIIPADDYFSGISGLPASLNINSGNENTYYTLYDANNNKVTDITKAVKVVINPLSSSLNSLTYTVSAPSLSKPSNNSITDVTGEIKVDLSTPVVINPEINDIRIYIDNVDHAIVTGKFPPNSKFSNIKVTGPNSNNYKLYDVNNNIVSDPSLAFKIVVPSTNLKNLKPTQSSQHTQYIVGYITNYTFDSTGNLNGTLNTFNNQANNTTTPVSGSVIKNVWGIVSPNNNDQILIMTSDSQYIFLNNTNNNIYSLIIFMSMAFFNFNILSDIPPNTPPSIHNLNHIYVSLYFIMKYGFNVGGGYFNFILTPVLSKKVTSLSTSDPNYIASNQISNPILKNLFIFYTVYTDIAKNGSNSSYYKLLNNNPLSLASFKSSDFQYAADYFNTLYSLYNKVPSNFCLNISGTLSIPYPVCDSYSTSVIKISDTQNTSRNNTPTTLDTSRNNTPTTLDTTLSTPSTNNSTGLTTTQILITIGIACAVLIAGLFIYRNMKSKKKNLTRNGGYYYFN